MPILGICALIAGLLGAVLGGYLSFSRGLPKIPDLRRYRPKTVSTFYAEDGTVIGIFYREKRFPIALSSIPPNVVNAFLAAEDARFFSHVGVDWIGVARAVVKNVQEGNFVQGGSTITQQVTRNFLLSRKKKISRKIREALLAFRLEETLTKREILELYLNEIYLGKGAYGVEAAARNYFGKATQELTIAEAALLAGLVSNPSKYAPHKNVEASLNRRKFVLESMLRNNFITEDQFQRASVDAPKFRENLPNAYQRAPYFAESVRQYIAAKYGEDRLYNEGLKVWTTCDLSLQRKASQALVKGVRSWEERRKRPTGLIQRLKKSEARAFLAGTAKNPRKVGETVEAIVLSNNSPKRRKKKKGDADFQVCEMALKGGATFTVQLGSKIRYRTNDLLHFSVTESDGRVLTLAPLTLPPVQGALVCIENHTGYVRALVGGTDFERSRFNRAMQAKRQPGSAFKPFVYTAALEWSRYGPQTVVVDEPIAVEVDPTEEEWVPANSDGNFFGPINLRQALAHSRNIAAVKLIMDVGIDTTIRMARNMGIQSQLGKNLSLCLGASEVTPLELTSAYTVFPNMGMRVQPVLVKKVVDRFGNVLEDNTMEPLNTDRAVSQWTPMPQPYPSGNDPRFPGPGTHDLARQARWHSTKRHGVTEGVRASTGIDSALSKTFPARTVATRLPVQRVLTPHSAYLMTSMLREVCESGTAAKVRRLGITDLAGKTGTTDDCTDAWFVGFSPYYTTGVWIGYDTKTSLGKREYGNVAALPVWTDFMTEVLAGSKSEGYPVPQGIVFWELDKPIQYARREELLRAGPDVPANYQAKPVCPVDSVVAPSAYQVDPYTGRPMALAVQTVPMAEHLMPAGFGAEMHPEMLRVLSPNGETLGQAYRTYDEKGNMTLYRENSQPYGPYQEPPMQDFADATGQPGSSAFSRPPWTHRQPFESPQPEGPGDAYGGPGSHPRWNGRGWQ